MLKASSSKKHTVKKEHMNYLDKTIYKMIEDNIALDKMEDKLYGDNDQNQRPAAKDILDKYWLTVISQGLNIIS